MFNLHKCSFLTHLPSPTEHPFEAEREYQRALNAVKLERVFAKPFLGSLDGHRDGLTCVSKHPTSLSTLCSASADGEVRVWHLTERKCLASWQVFIAPFTYAILWLILFFSRSAKKVCLHRRKLHVVYRVDPPLERARRNTALNVIKTFEKHQVTYCVDHSRVKLVHGMKLWCIFQKMLFL